MNTAFNDAYEEVKKLYETMESLGAGGGFVKFVDENGFPRKVQFSTSSTFLWDRSYTIFYNKTHWKISSVRFKDNSISHWTGMWHVNYKTLWTATTLEEISKLLWKARKNYKQAWDAIKAEPNKDDREALYNKALDKISPHKWNDSKLETTKRVKLSIAQLKEENDLS